MNVQDVVRAAVREHGCRLDRTGRGHAKLVLPDGRKVPIGRGSKSQCPRAGKNLRSMLRHMGVDID